MSDRIDEQLSALADDELPAAELPLLWRRWGSERRLRDRWHRYHLYGDALRNALPRELDRRFADRVATAVAAEALPSRAAGSWLRRIGGVAVAASVMVAALLSLRVDDPAPDTDDLIVTPTTANPQVRGASFASTQGLQWERARPEVQQELNAYLLTHGDAAVEAAEGSGR